MKRIQTLFAAIALCSAFLFGTQNAVAGGPFKFGVKAGMTINELKFNEDAFSSSNREGFTGGLMVQFVAPIINIGFDASLMYTHRSTRITTTGEDLYGESISARTIGRDYIEIPINFKWEIGLPLIGKFVTPFITTGPDLSFLISKQNIDNAWNNKKFDFAWNFGFGLQIVNKVQLAASYGLGLNNSASADDALYGSNLGDGKDRFWTITAAYLF